MKKEQIRNQEIHRLSASDNYVFPRYVTQLLNLVNSNAQGTRLNCLKSLAQELRLNGDLTMMNTCLMG